MSYNWPIVCARANQIVQNLRIFGILTLWTAILILRNCCGAFAREIEKLPLS